VKFLFAYELGETSECRDVRDLPDLDAAKAHARDSLENTLKASSADFASIRIGERQGDGEDDVRWLGAYDLERDGEPVWSGD
jgi:hypothetical protein